MEMLTEYLAKGFMVMLSISMPCVLTAAAIGLVVGIIQAVTQVQEQTIAAAPKIFAVFLVIVIGGMGFINCLQTSFLMEWRLRLTEFLKMTALYFLQIITSTQLLLREK